MGPIAILSLVLIFCVGAASGSQQSCSTANDCVYNGCSGGVACGAAQVPFDFDPNYFRNVRMTAGQDPGCMECCCAGKGCYCQNGICKKKWVCEDRGWAECPLRPCPPGSFSATGKGDGGLNYTSGCTECPAGKYNEGNFEIKYTHRSIGVDVNIGATSCSDCPAGKTSPAGSDEIADCIVPLPACPENANRPLGSQACICNEGFTGSDDGTCTPCAERNEEGGFPNLLLHSNVTVSDECFKTLPCDGRPTGMEFLIDGSDGAPHLRDYWHSCSTGHDAWAKFTLQQVSSIFRIELVNRHDCCESRITGSSVFVFDTQSQEEVFCGNVTSTGRGAKAYIETTGCSGASRRAGYVKIYGPHGGKDFLHISEVKAFGVTAANKCTSSSSSSTPAPTTSSSSSSTPAPTTSSSSSSTPAPMTPTPHANITCEGDTKTFSVNGIDLCVPAQLYPDLNVSHCVFDKTWEDVHANRYIFQTGGLGKRMRGDAWKVWVCGAQLPCALEAHDWLCFTYNEFHDVFVPLGYNRELLIVRKC